jgi:hypothetical protein
MSETMPGRLRKGTAWVDAPIPRAIADLVQALNKNYCEVAGVTEDTITLVDGRVLHVRFGWRTKARS